MREPHEPEPDDEPPQLVPDLKEQPLFPWDLCRPRWPRDALLVRQRVWLLEEPRRD